MKIFFMWLKGIIKILRVTIQTKKKKGEWKKNARLIKNDYLFT